MTRANTDTEPKYQNANTGTGNIVEVMLVPVTNCAYTGSEPKCRIDSTGTSTIFECQYR